MPDFALFPLIEPGEARLAEIWQDCNPCATGLPGQRVATDARPIPLVTIVASKAAEAGETLLAIALGKRGKGESEMSW